VKELVCVVLTEGGRIGKVANGCNSVEEVGTLSRKNNNNSCGGHPQEEI